MIKDLERFEFGFISHLFSKKGVWIGDNSPINCKAINIGLCKNYRLSPIYHRKYDVVWLYEDIVFNYGSGWRLVIDESIRLINESGYLVIRTKDSNKGTIFELKSLLARNTGLDVSLDQQELLRDGSIVSVFKINRKNIELYSNKLWTIGVITNGEKEDVISSLILKTLKLIDRDLVEFIIVGPKLNGLSEIDLDLKYFDLEYKDDLARISKKKKLILEKAKNPNVAIFHDRYIINDDFFEGFEYFGYDFDYLTISQNYESGSYFPSYVGFEYRSFKWQNPCYEKSYNELFEGHFVNGGLIILKKTKLTISSFNSLLLHNEAEDVELAFLLRCHGIVPRMNFYSSATTVGIADNYTDSFKLYVHLKTQEPAIVEHMKKIAENLWKKLPNSLKSRLRYSRAYNYVKEFLFHY